MLSNCFIAGHNCQLNEQAQQIAGHAGTMDNDTLFDYPWPGPTWRQNGLRRESADQTYWIFSAPPGTFRPSC